MIPFKNKAGYAHSEMVGKIQHGAGGMGHGAHPQAPSPKPHAFFLNYQLLARLLSQFLGIAHQLILHLGEILFLKCPFGLPDQLAVQGKLVAGFLHDKWFLYS